MMVAQKPTSSPLPEGPVIAGAQPPHPPAICALTDSTTLSRTYISRSPSWFFRPFPVSNRVSYSDNSNNYVVDLDTGHETLIPGEYDGVPTPDERYLTTPVPKDGTRHTNVMNIHSMAGALSGSTAPLIADADFDGVYQSTGILHDLGPETTYRIITDMNDLSFRDYQIAHATGETDATVTPLGPPTALCAGMKLKLPMLSKDGRHLSALDIDAGTTKIFEFDPAGRCTETHDLGIKTGKADFSYDGGKLTFHAMNNDSLEGGYFNTPSDAMVSNVYVFDLRTRELRRLTQNTDSNAVYPAFRRDGKIVYMEHPRQAEFGPRQASFVVADPGLARPVAYDAVLGRCVNTPRGEQYPALVALGSLWSRLCSFYGISTGPTASALTTLSLNPAQCRQMVERYWESYREQIARSEILRGPGGGATGVSEETLRGLRKADLLAACPRDRLRPARPKTVGTVTVVTSPRPEPGPTRKPKPAHAGSAAGTPAEPPSAPGAAVPESCVLCHANWPLKDHAKLSAMKGAGGTKPLIDEIFRRMSLKGQGKMPPGDMRLETPVRERFERYLMTGK
jgi:hypothetical protein